MGGRSVRRTAVRQSLGVHQAPQRPARLAVTASSPGRHRRLAASTTNPGISPRLRLSHRPCLPASSGCSPALLVRLFGNGTNPGRRGASPEGACRAEYRGAATVTRRGYRAAGAGCPPSGEYQIPCGVMAGFGAVGNLVRWHDESRACCPPLRGRGCPGRRIHHPGPSRLLHRRCAREGRTRRRHPPGLGPHDSGTVAGIAVAARKSLGGAEILWLAVDASRRGRGHGTRLLGHVLDHLATAGVSVV